MGSLGKITYQAKPGESVINGQSFVGTAVPQKDGLWEENTDYWFCLLVSPNKIEMNITNFIW
jgi:hypothetical protein